MSLPGLQSHENIIKLFGWDWFEDWQNEETNRGLSPALIMEFAELGTLRQFLRQTAVAPLQKLSLSFQVALGLDAIHKSGVIHGDIKLENVLMYRKSATEVTPKITDFGNSLLESSSESEYNCTLEYRAPELLKHSNLVPVSRFILCDIFSYGLLVWEVLLDGRYYYDYAGLASNEDIAEEQTILTYSMDMESAEKDAEESDLDSMDFQTSDSCEVSSNKRNKKLQFAMRAAREYDKVLTVAEKDKYTEVFLQTLQEDPRMRVQSLSEVKSILAAEENSSPTE
jgi:serine/threonine protein kinase